jgi:hypothetical protein
VHEVAAGSARREEPGGHTSKAQQVASKVTADEPMSLKGVKGRMPAYYSTVHDIDTAKQPQGCGGQQGWDVQGEPLRRMGGAVRFYA